MLFAIFVHGLLMRSDLLGRVEFAWSDCLSRERQAFRFSWRLILFRHSIGPEPGRVLMLPRLTVLLHIELASGIRMTERRMDYLAKENVDTETQEFEALIEENNVLHQRASQEEKLLITKFEKYMRFSNW